MKLTKKETALQIELKRLISINGLWSKEVYDFNGNLDTRTLLRIHDNLRK